MRTIDKQTVDATIAEIKRLRRVAVEEAARKNQDLDQYAVHVPCRVVGMRMMVNQNTEAMVQTILPPMVVMLPNSDNTRVLVSRIRYTLDNVNQQGLPIAHVFRSGGVCFGTVPVPQTVHSAHCLRPLDILLGYNDRVTAHGGASLKPTAQQRERLKEFCNRMGVEVPTSSTFNWIDSDVPWVFCHKLLNTFDEETALQYAAEFYNIIWETPKTNITKLEEE